MITEASAGTSCIGRLPTSGIANPVDILFAAFLPIIYVYSSQINLIIILHLPIT